MAFSEIFHKLELIEGYSLPEQMNNPFDYVPHPLCCRAAEEVCAYLGERSEWSGEIAEGKMFGVLIVRSTQGEIGYLAAFSGNLAGSNFHSGFVPPVYDMLQPDDRFRIGEAEISAINRRIEQIESSALLSQMRESLAEALAKSEQEISSAKHLLDEQKALRDIERATTSDPERLAELIRESQHQKAEFARLKKYWREEQARLKADIDAYQQEVDSLRVERKRRSEELQMWIFKQFRILNARGQERDLCEIFAPTPQRIPPAGAGECAAPKLLQYAYQNNFEPLAMAEFWQGCSPRGEVRRHGAFYPSCQGKCGPILGFMLQGLNVEKREVARPLSPTLIYEDEWLAVVAKPAEMLSVEGRCEKWSVEQWAREKFTDAQRVMPVHRLDMSTSGVLVVAKSLDAYRALQGEFNACRVAKKYIALLEGDIMIDEGRIELPLAADYANRPCQKVDFESGKPAITEYRVLERREGRTLVEFSPLTGRTHQLRLHAAHAEGLNAPIVGDTLYGNRDRRLFLHAAYIAFTHPATGEWVEFNSPCDF